MNDIVDKTCGFMLLQSDWNKVLHQEGNSVWITLKHHNCDLKNTHGEISVKAFNSKHPLFDSPEGFEIKKFSKYAISIFNSSFGITTQFIAPIQEFENIHKKRIVALDISSGGGLGVSAATDETFCIWETGTGEVRRRLIGHVGEVNCCKFFPSGLVVLSGGMDTQLKIWSAEDGSCARTLNGVHKGGILFVDFIERGRNIVSCSRDGTLRLWDCSSGTNLDAVVADAAEINSCSITDVTENLFEVNSNSNKSELEIGTQNKLLITACENGFLRCYGLHKRSLLFALKHNDALNCCCFVNATTIVAGSQDGTLLIVDLRWPKDFLVCFKPCSSPVRCLHPSKATFLPGFWASCGNGRCTLYQIVINFKPHEDAIKNCPYKASLKLVCELTGSDCDPVYQVVESSDGFVYTSCRDAIIRKYKLAHIT